MAIFWVAGFETTAHTIGWAFMLLATHPEAERMLAEELEAHGLLATPATPRCGAVHLACAAVAAAAMPAW
jgi:cytochrome P450